MKKCLCALLAMGLLLLGGCELVSINREKDYAQVVAVVNGADITKGQVYDEMNPSIIQNGLGNIYDDALEASLRKQVDASLPLLLEDMIQRRLIDIIVDRDMPLSEEEQQKLEKEYQDNIDIIKVYFLGFDEQHPEDYDGDIEADVDAYLAFSGISRAYLRDSAVSAVKEQKLYDAITKDITADEASLLARYTADLKEQREAYAKGEDGYKTLAAFTDSSGQASTGTYMLYKPEGYFTVKQILLAFSEADSKVMEDLDTEITAQEAELTEAQTALTTAQSTFDGAKAKAIAAETEKAILLESGKTEEAAAQQVILEEQTAIMDTQQAAIDAAQKEKDDQQAVVDDLNKQLADAQTQAGAHLAATVAEIKNKYNAGTAFDELIQQYNIDEGSKEGPHFLYGYPIAPTVRGYVQPFLDAADKLTTVGELSDAAISEYGVHILKLELGKEAMDLPFETVQSLVKTKEDDRVKQETWDAKMKEWSAEFGVKTYDGRLKFIR